MNELKSRTEALLFSAGRRLSNDELLKLLRADKEQLESALKELKEDYSSRDSAIMLVEEGSGWKLSVRENYLSLVQRIVSDTELTKTIMETLAVIAWRAPVLQSDVIKIRTNKAYDHIRELDELGFISRERKGRTMLIRLTQKFFDYFDLRNQEEVRERFKILSPSESREIKPVPKSEAEPQKNAVSSSAKNEESEISGTQK